MVCIIDDREDVWNYAPNLIHVKPYHYFKNVGDINAPFPKTQPKTKPPPAGLGKSATSETVSGQSDSASSANGPLEVSSAAVPESTKHQYESRYFLVQ